MTLLLLLLFVVLALALLSGDWRLGLLLTVVIGFAQDPIRKFTPGQPGLYVGLVLVAFAACSFLLFQRRNGRFELPRMFPYSPRTRRWLPAFVLLIALQAVNPSVRDSELNALRKQREQGLAMLDKAALRLEAISVLVAG